MADLKELEPPKVKPPFQTPANLLTSKTMPNGEPTSMRGGGDHHHDGLQSVSQKAKLILPTALWILIVVAGLCFLSLLSSLNKSINTLDTLVEIEQANAKHAKHHHAPEASASVLADDDMFERPPKSSWLSLPSWTSLEPSNHQRHHHRCSHSKHQRKPADLGSEDELGAEMVKELMDEMVKDLPMPGGDKMGPVRGKIVVASSVSPRDDRESNGGEIASLFSGIDSMFKQLLVNPEQLENRPVEIPAAASDNQQGPLITANIDTVNIHVSDGERKNKNKNKNKKPEKMVQSDAERRLGESLEKMIDAIEGHVRQSSERPSQELSETILIPLAPKHRTSHHGHHHGGSQLLPILGSSDDGLVSLSDLLLPQSFGIGAQPAVHHRKPKAHQSFNPFEALLAPGIQQQASPGEFVIHLGDDKPKGKSPSPYELMPIDIAGSSSGKPSADLDSLLSQTLFPVQESSPTTTTTKSSNKETTTPLIISSLDLLPSLGGDGLAPQMTGDRKANKNSVNDLFSLFFGPPPNSSLVVAPQSVEPKSDSTTLKPSSEVPASLSESSIKSLLDLESSSTPGPSKESPTTTPMPAEPSSSSPPASGPLELSAVTSSRKRDSDPASIADPLIDDFLGSMFSLPQMSGQSGPVRADSGSGSSAGGNRVNTNETAPTLAPAPTSVSAPTTVSPASTTANTTSSLGESMVEKVVEIVEPVKDAELPALSNPLMLDLLAKELKIVHDQATSKGPTQAPSTPSTTSPMELKPSTESPKGSPEEADKEARANNPAEVEIFEASKQTTTSPNVEVHDTTRQPATSESTPTTDQPMSAVTQEASTPSAKTTIPPFKAFLKKADDFIERNISNFKKLLA